MRNLLKNKNFWNLLANILIAGCVFFVLLRNNFSAVLSLIWNSNIFLVLIGLLIILLWWVIETYIFITIAKIIDIKYPFFKAFFATITGQFYSALTPSSSGGQIFQLITMKKQGFKTTTASIMLATNFITYVGSLLLMSCVAILFTSHFYIHYVPNYWSWVLLGIITNAGAFVLLQQAAIHKGFHHKLYHMIKKICIIFKYKKTEKLLSNFETSLAEFRLGFKFLLKYPKKFGYLIIINTIRLFILHLLPLIVMLALRISFPFPLPQMMLLTISASILIILISNLIPLPGGSGGAEYLFLAFYSFIFKDDTTIAKAALILWRSLQFYFSLIIGGIITTIYSLYLNHSINKKKN